MKIIFAERVLFKRMLRIKFRGTLRLFAIIKKRSHWCWYTHKKEFKSGNSWTKVGAINPYYRWKNKLGWYANYWWMRLNNKLYMRCEACGDGVSQYRIRDPNEGNGNEWINCCDRCVHFYDRRFSAIKIVGWKNERPVCKKIC